MAIVKGEIVRLGAPAMGTRFELVLAGGDTALLRAAGEAALAEVGALSERLSAFGRGSMLTYVNEHASDGAVPVDRELFDLLWLCRQGWFLSEGAFDITVGPLMEAWGFRGRSHGGVDEAMERVGMDQVELNPVRGTVRFARAGMKLDLGGVAKGYALDVSEAILRNAGVGCALMHAGTSSVVAIGAPHDEDGWRVRAASRTISLKDRSLSVSAPHGRLVGTVDGLAGHVLDPRIGAPIRGASVACAVCPSGAWAEVWSTALLVLGRRPAGVPEDVDAIVELTPSRLEPQEVHA